MPKGKDNLKPLDERYPDVAKKKAENFTLATAEEPEDSEKKEKVMEALGEQPQQRDVRHLVETGNKQNLILEGDPEKQIAYAQKASQALMTIVTSKPKKVMINGEQYMEYEDWQTLGRFYGATVGIEWTKPVVVNGKTWGYEARALVYRGDAVISAAEAMCTRSERNWARRDEFMLRSMAQTRASAKALRNVFAWVAVMAGLKSTPAEEMDSFIEEQKPKLTPEQEQKLKIITLLKQLGIGAVDKAGYEAAVLEKTQLALLPENYAEIIARLSIEIQTRAEK